MNSAIYQLHIPMLIGHIHVVIMLTNLALIYSGVPRNFFRGGVQQIHLRTEDREDGDLGVVVP